MNLLNLSPDLNRRGAFRSHHRVDRFAKYHARQVVQDVIERVRLIISPDGRIEQVAKLRTEKRLDSLLGRPAHPDANRALVGRYRAEGSRVALAVGALEPGTAPGFHLTHRKVFSRRVNRWGVSTVLWCYPEQHGLDNQAALESALAGHWLAARFTQERSLRLSLESAPEGIASAITAERKVR